MFCGTCPLSFFGSPGEVLAGPPLRRRVEEDSEENSRSGRGLAEFRLLP
jgi:hypothetical protein